MKMFFVVLVLGISAGCGAADPATPKTVEESRFAQMEKLAQGIRYLKDKRTNPPTCYAYVWDGMGNGGPGFAAVECDRIPPELLPPSHR